MVIKIYIKNWKGIFRGKCVVLNTYIKKENIPNS